MPTKKSNFGRNKAREKREKLPAWEILYGIPGRNFC